MTCVCAARVCVIDSKAVKKYLHLIVGEYPCYLRRCKHVIFPDCVWGSSLVPMTNTVQSIMVSQLASVHLYKNNYRIVFMCCHNLL